MRTDNAFQHSRNDGPTGSESEADAPADDLVDRILRGAYRRFCRDKETQTAVGAELLKDQVPVPVAEIRGVPPKASHRRPTSR